MEIEVIFKEDGKYKKIIFSNYATLGVWVSNNYENEIVEIIVSED